MDLEDTLAEGVSSSQRIGLRSCQIIWRGHYMFIELGDGLVVRTFSLAAVLKDAFIEECLDL